MNKTNARIELQKVQSVKDGKSIKMYIFIQSIIWVEEQICFLFGWD